MNIIQKIATGSGCYQAGAKITVKGLMLHSVGCNQPRAEVFANQWMRSNDVCCHGVLQADGTVYQTLPWNHRGWHCGDSGNNTHIGVEMTEPSQIHYTGGCSFTCSDKAAALEQVRGTYKTAVELFAYLCKQFSLNPLADGVIVSHNEGYKRGIASGHNDPEHLWNQLNSGLTMNGFRQDVARAMNGSTSTTTSSIPAQDKLYRVRKSWDDVRSQIGAYRALDSAKGICKEGYFVFDNDGKIVYPLASVPTKVEAPSKWTYNKDEDITKLQKILNNKGAKLTVDGIAGDNTYNAVSKYTINFLDRGELTAWVQARLNKLGFDCGVADGIAGSRTMSGIKEFQLANNLGTGYLGGTDWYYLIK